MEVVIVNDIIYYSRTMEKISFQKMWEILVDRKGRLVVTFKSSKFSKHIRHSSDMEKEVVEAEEEKKEQEQE